MSETKNTDKSVGEYMSELLGKLDKDENGNDKYMGEIPFISENLFEICRMIREFGIYYIEDLMTVRRITLNITIMANVKICLQECAKKIFDMYESYIDIKGLDRTENMYKYFIFNEDNEEVGKLFKFKNPPKNVYSILKEYVCNNESKITCSEITRVLCTFIDYTDEYSDILQYMFTERKINNKFSNYVREKIEQVYGLPFNVLIDRNINILFTQAMGLATCLVNKRMIYIKGLPTNCVGHVKNKNRNESTIIFNTQKHENLETDTVQPNGNGRVFWSPIKDNLFIKYMQHVHKLTLAGISNTTIKLLTLINLFDYELYNIDYINYHLIICLMVSFSPKHHSCAEILLSSKMFYYYNQQGVLVNMCDNININESLINILTNIINDKLHISYKI